MEVGLPSEVPHLVHQRSRSFDEVGIHDVLSLPRSRSVDLDEGGTGGLFSDGECVKVVVRVRPESELERSRGRGTCLSCTTARTITVTVDDRVKSFAFDRVFPPSTGQEELYLETGRPLVTGLLNGINGTVLAYGMTGAGKTYTMQGEEGETRGIVPRLFYDVFETAAECKSDVFDFRASFLEIYQETVYDLLTPGLGERGSRPGHSESLAGHDRLRIYEDARRGLFITGATEVPVSNVGEALRVYYEGVRNRHIAETRMNRDSSRSHAVFILTLARQEVARNVTKFSQIYLVDLAGAECVYKTGAEGERLEEAKYINKSLLALGLVIYGLASGAEHIPYRDSKLTRLLQNSLGGNSRTVLIVNLSPSTWSAPETVSSLQFGDATKRIRNKPVANEVLGIEELESLLAEAHTTLARNATRIERLEAEFAQFRSFFGAMGLEPWEIDDLQRASLRADIMSPRGSLGKHAGAGGLWPPVDVSSTGASGSGDVVEAKSEPPPPMAVAWSDMPTGGPVLERGASTSSGPILPSAPSLRPVVRRGELESELARASMTVLDAEVQALGARHLDDDEVELGDSEERDGGGGGGSGGGGGHGASRRVSVSPDEASSRHKTTSRFCGTVNRMLARFARDSQRRDEKRKAAEGDPQCTFTPAITSRGRLLQRCESVTERLAADAARRLERAERLRASRFPSQGGSEGSPRPPSADSTVYEEVFHLVPSLGVQESALLPSLGSPVACHRSATRSRSRSSSGDQRGIEVLGTPVRSVLVTRR